MAISIILFLLTLESYHTANILYYGFYPSFERNKSEIRNEKISFTKKKNITNKLIDIKSDIKKIASGEISQKKVDGLKSDLLDKIDHLPKDNQNIHEYIIHKIRYFRVVSMYYRNKGYPDKAQSNYRKGSKFIEKIEKKYSLNDLRNWEEINEYIQTYEKEEVFYRDG